MIRNNDECAVWTYEMGFDHFNNGIPLSPTCDHMYYLGWITAKEKLK